MNIEVLPQIETSLASCATFATQLSAYATILFIFCVVKVKTEKFKAVLHKGVLELLPLPHGDAGIEELPFNRFPEPGRKADITCMQVTSVFLIFGTASGSIFYYYHDNNTPTLIQEYCHYDGGITRHTLQLLVIALNIHIWDLNFGIKYPSIIQSFNLVAAGKESREI